MVARGQVQISLIICETRREGCPRFDASIDACVHPLGNHIDKCACISIAGRRNIVVFHLQDLVGRNAFQVNVRGCYAIDQNLHATAVHALNLIGPRVDLQVFYVLKQVTYISGQPYLVGSKGIDRLIHIVHDMCALHRHTVDGIFSRLHLDSANVTNQTVAIGGAIAYKTTLDDDTTGICRYHKIAALVGNSTAKQRGIDGIEDGNIADSGQADGQSYLHLVFEALLYI